MFRSERLAGANRQYIEEVIPHIGSLLSADLEQVVRSAEVVIIGNKSIKKEQLIAVPAAKPDCSGSGESGSR